MSFDFKQTKHMLQLQFDFETFLHYLTGE